MYIYIEKGRKRRRKIQNKLVTHTHIHTDMQVSVFVRQLNT